LISDKSFIPLQIISNTLAIKICIYILSFIFFLVICNENSSGQTMPLPINIQAALMTKVLKFNSRLAERSLIRMLIVYNNTSSSSKDALLSQLDKSIEAKAILPEEIEENINVADVVYFMPGLEETSKVCKTNNVLTITGIVLYVEEGDISIALGIMNDKPKVFINITSLKSEEQNISSDLLRIAKVYK
jgi:hypothetical protein